MDSPDFKNDFLCIIRKYPDAMLYKQTAIDNPFAVLWIHTFYFEKRVTVLLPKMYLSYFVECMNQFNESINIKLDETHFDVKFDDLETIEYLKTNDLSITLMLYADFIFHKLHQCNKRRLATFLKNIRGTVYTKNYTNLERFGFQKCLSQFKGIPNISVFEYSEESFEDFIELLCDCMDSSTYVSIHVPNKKLLEIENEVSSRSIQCFRKEQPGGAAPGTMVIQSSKTLKSGFLNNTYSRYFIIAPECQSEYELLYYIKDIDPHAEVFFEESQIESVEKHLEVLGQSIKPSRKIINESQPFETFEDCIDTLEDYSIVSESFYRFKTPESFEKFDYSNMNKKQYDIIRDFVKLKFLSKWGIIIKTCQLATPCSPKDRSKKLNSLGNKISSNDYRCDCTVELFKDNTMGVVVWNSMFADRKTFEAVSGNYVYQTTHGMWKRSIVKIN
jgi:hypothetical protein